MKKKRKYPPRGKAPIAPATKNLAAMLVLMSENPNQMPEGSYALLGKMVSTGFHNVPSENSPVP